MAVEYRSGLTPAGTGGVGRTAAAELAAEFKRYNTLITRKLKS